MPRNTLPRKLIVFHVFQEKLYREVLQSELPRNSLLLINCRVTHSFFKRIILLCRIAELDGKRSITYRRQSYRVTGNPSTPDGIPWNQPWCPGNAES